MKHEQIQRVVIDRMQPNPGGREWHWSIVVDDREIATGEYRTLEGAVQGLNSFLKTKIARPVTP